MDPARAGSHRGGVTRGPCPPALAAEVHALTLASVLRRVRPDSPHRQTISDVVGEAFLRWLARPDDKTAHAAGEHAHHLARTALHYLTCPRTRRRGADHARPIAEWATVARGSSPEVAGEGVEATSDFEAALRVMRGRPEAAADAEDDLLDRLDAARRLLRGRACTTAHEALAALEDRGWSTAQVAAGAGVSENAVLEWGKGRTPHAPTTATLVRLAAADGLPPPPRTRPVPRLALAPAPDAQPADAALDALASLLRSRTHGSLAAELGVTRQAVTMWASGRRLPAPAARAALVRLALTEAQAPAIMAA